MTFNVAGKPENEILDFIYEGLPETEMSVSLYPASEGKDDDELYLTYGGMCYRVIVTRHRHPDDA
jgi:hypothetical protein